MDPMDDKIRMCNDSDIIEEDLNPPCRHPDPIFFQAQTKNRLTVEIFGHQEKQQQQPQGMLVFLCVPVAPGKSRLIWAFPRSVDAWPEKMIPRWLYHMVSNTVLDSDLYLLHVEERNFAAAGLDNWHKACYVPTSSDNMILTFRNWFR
uniref:Pheophorbide a oxygenase domain-containing protein n=1 Tax=Oryza brachyantha TaxID=4533 RepID=J3LTW9_ORYBR